MHSLLEIDLLPFSPQLIHIKEAYNNSNRENLAQAFDFAQKHYGIMQLIDPEGSQNPPSFQSNSLLSFRCGHG